MQRSTATSNACSTRRGKTGIGDGGSWRGINDAIVFHVQQDSIQQAPRPPLKCQSKNCCSSRWFDDLDPPIGMAGQVTRHVARAVDKHRDGLPASGVNVRQRNGMAVCVRPLMNMNGVGRHAGVLSPVASRGFPALPRANNIALRDFESAKVNYGAWDRQCTVARPVRWAPWPIRIRSLLRF
jgi:hypothetical protein